MIGVSMPDLHATTEFAPTMLDRTGILPGLSAVGGKPLHAAFDGGRQTSDVNSRAIVALTQSRCNAIMLR